MASEDNFLRLDPYNYANEWHYIIENYTFSLEEIKELFKNGSICHEDYIYALDYLKGML